MAELSLSEQGVTLHGQELVKRLGVLTDRGLRFNEHVSYICKKAAQQLNSLSRLSSVPIESIFNTCIISNFTYCPLIWHMCSSADARSIQKIQERSLLFVLNHFTCGYRVLMEQSPKFTIYLDRLRQLCVGTFEATNELTPIFASDIFQTKTHVHSYNLRDTNTLSLYKYTTKYRQLSLRYEAANIWN